MENMYIVKIGNKYLRINYTKGTYCLVDDKDFAEKFFDIETAKSHVNGTIDDGKYLNKKKTILKYKISFVEEICDI